MDILLFCVHCISSFSQTYRAELLCRQPCPPQTPVVMDLSPGPGLSHMTWRVQQVSGNPPWQSCFCVTVWGQMVPVWAGTPGRAGFPRWTATDLRCGSGPKGWGAGGSFCAADPCWLQGHRSGGRRGGLGDDKWVSENGWLCHPRGPASSSSPLVSCRICAACV